MGSRSGCSLCHPVLCQLPAGGLPTRCIIDEEAQRAVPAWHFRDTNEASLGFLQWYTDPQGLCLGDDREKPPEDRGRPPKPPTWHRQHLGERELKERPQVDHSASLGSPPIDCIPLSLSVLICKMEGERW